MKVITGKFIAWLMSLTTFVRYLVIAILFHVLILFVMGSVKIVAEMPKIIAAFDSAALPPPVKDIDADPFAALRDFDYNGPTLGGNGAGVKTAAGTTPTEYKTKIAAATDKNAADTQVSEVFGVISESANAVARLQGGFGSMAAPTTGFGEGKIGTAGIKGPGGGGFGQRVGPMQNVCYGTVLYQLLQTTQFRRDGSAGQGLRRNQAVRRQRAWRLHARATQTQSKPAASTQPAFKRQRAAHQLGQLACNGQAQAGYPPLPHRGDW